MRLARKVGPIFGVMPETERGARGPWLGDYTRVTLTEIMRGAPTPARRLAPQVKDDRGVSITDDIAPIANATAARFGPDTKAAFVLTGANVLFRPISRALLEALDGYRTRCPEIARRPDLLVGAYAYIVTELFRSEPALLQAAVQAQAVQRALTAVQGAPISGGGLDSFAAHEWGWPEASEHTEAPTDLHILDELARDLSQQLQPYLLPTSADDEQVPPEHRLRRAIVGITIATLLDLSKGQLDAGIRMVESPSGRRADLIVDFEQRTRLFAYSIVPHVRSSGGSRPGEPEGAHFPERDDSLEVFSALHRMAPPPITGDDLSDRANLTVYSGLLEGYVALFGARGVRRSAVWHRKLDGYASAVAEVTGAGSPEHLLAALRAATARIRYTTVQDDDFPEEFPDVTSLICRATELIGELQALADAGILACGRLYPVVNTLLVSLHQIRELQALAPKDVLPDVDWLNKVLSDLWLAQLERLGQFFRPDTRQYAVRLHNYAAFLVGEGATLRMLDDGDALFDGEKSLIEIRKSVAGTGDTLLGPALRGARHTAQVAIRGWARHARAVHDRDPRRAAALLAKAERHAAQVEEYLASLSQPGHASAEGTFDAEYRDLKLRVCLAHLYQTRAELGVRSDEGDELRRRSESHLLAAHRAVTNGVVCEPTFPVEIYQLARRLVEQNNVRGGELKMPVSRELSEIVDAFTYG